MDKALPSLRKTTPPVHPRSSTIAGSQSAMELKKLASKKERAGTGSSAENLSSSKKRVVSPKPSPKAAARSQSLRERELSGRSPVFSKSEVGTSVPSPGKEKRKKKAPIPTPSVQLSPSEPSEVKATPLPTPSSPPSSLVGKKEGVKARILSITKRQDKLLRRLSRRSKECPDHLSSTYWSPAPRFKYRDGSTPSTTATTTAAAITTPSSSSTPVSCVGGPGNLVRSSSMRRGPPKTVSAQFQASLISLMERLEQTNPFFVRCIKSNSEKVKGIH